MKFSISNFSSSHSDFVEEINKKIDSEAKTKRNLSPMFHYAYQATKDNKPIGGIFGFDNFGALHIEGLWVDTEFRGNGVGRKLIEAAEQLAHVRKCKCIALFTMDFQAYEFYLHLGYEKEFIRDHYHNNSKAIYMVKPVDY